MTSRTRQQCLDTAVAAIVKQGKPSMKSPFNCCYRGPDGTKCAIGHLISDEDYKPRWDRRRLSANHEPIGKAVGRSEDGFFLLSLQRCHDNASHFKGGEFIMHFKRNVANVARQFNLKFEP